MRYFSGPLKILLPDYSAAGVTSDIVVTDLGTIDDLDITFNITHMSDSDIDMTLTSPLAVGLFTDRGSTGNDFLDTTLDDEAAEMIPSTSTGAPFTGSWLPEDGNLFNLDGLSTANTFTLKVADDASNNYGTFDDWSLRIESPDFAEAYDGRAEDNTTYDTGICSVELLPGATNLALTVDPAFVAGRPVVRYLVEQVDLSDVLVSSTGTVRITDCAGNTCDADIELEGSCGWADFDDDLDIDHADYQTFLGTFGHSAGDAEYDANPGADHDQDGIVTGLDYQAWLQCFRDAGGMSPVEPQSPTSGNLGQQTGTIKPHSAGWGG